MFFPKIYYKEPVYRPPAEAESLLIQVTEGCTHSCEFCVGNYGKKFLVRDFEKIKKDIEAAKQLYGNSVRKMFLLDGNAFVAETDLLVKIAMYAKSLHPKLKRIGAYAHASDILIKPDEELKAIAESGIKIAYVGIETGDDELLNNINKKTNSSEIAQAAHKLYSAGITLSGTIILGLAGNDKEKSYRHAVETATLINSMKPESKLPWYISALTLMIHPESRLHKKVQSKEFIPMRNIEILEELKVFLGHLDDDLEGCIFRANHASNYLPLESNNLARNKNELINTISYALSHQEVLKPEFMRGL